MSGARIKILNGLRDPYGAVRHKGFIPWDDDIDVTVPRPDYDRLLLHPEWFDAPYKLSTPLTDDYPQPFAKLFDTRWVAQEPFLEGVENEYLWIDIFPVDAIPDEDEKAYAILRKWYRDLKRASRSIANVDRVTTDSLKKAVKHLTFPVYRRIFPYRKLFYSMDEIAKVIPYGSTKRVANLVWPVYWQKPIWVNFEEYENLIDLDFEGYALKSIPGWDAHLRAIYGDYMQLPTESQRRTHGMKVWHNE